MLSYADHVKSIHRASTEMKTETIQFQNSFETDLKLFWNCFVSVSFRCADSLNIQGGPKKLAHFCVRLITSSNIDQFSIICHCQNQNKTTSVTTPFKSASSNSKADIYIYIEHLMKKLQDVTVTINSNWDSTLFPAVNLLKCVVTEVLFPVVDSKTPTFHKVV